MTFLEAASFSPFLLTDGGIETRIAFETDIPLDPEMGVARLIEDDRGRTALEEIYRQYLDVGRRHRIPMQVGMPTFRAGPERLYRAGMTDPDDLGRINRAGYRLLARLRDELGDSASEVFIAGVIGPRGDAYRPRDAPDIEEARAYHRAQVEALAVAGVDLLYAPTLPAAAEAIGVAMAMSEAGLPYVISPIIDGRGMLLDGTPMAGVVARIDEVVAPRPAFYTVSCVHPSVLRQALQADEELRRMAGHRLLGIKANASTKSPEELVKLDHLDSEDPGRLADEVMGLRGEFGLRVLGGCCGTDYRYIEALADRLAAGRR